MPSWEEIQNYLRETKTSLEKHGHMVIDVSITNGVLTVHTITSTIPDELFELLKTKGKLLEAEIKKLDNGYDITVYVGVGYERIPSSR